MTKDELIALTKEAGHCQESETLPVSDGFLERFAALVAAHEREECAKVRARKP